MKEAIEISQPFELAASYVNTTDRHIYLTGKAGTGKTTFLKYIKQHCHKKMAVAAPTGVAAINAGGVTLHSLFQLPLGSFLPDQQLSGEEHGEFFDKQSLLKYLRLNSAKRVLLRELELLVIDEVSMLRADLLDAIDAVLRSVRRRPSVPFGGVQLLFIGDLFQLPPVVRHQEWRTLSQFYETIAFFHAIALRDVPPIYLELKNIYRQSDERFIRLLNKIRNNKMDRGDLELLNKYYTPGFEPERQGEYITLTTHNHRADTINQRQLERLDGRIHHFRAEIWGDFDEKTVMAEMELKLKEGAQVMFVRNDREEPSRYYNGKIATVKRIDQDDITVMLADTQEEVLVQKEEWENKRYRLNKETDELEGVVKGTFTQYPIRLAWAITIHKSQGLTFDKAIIDAGKSFSAGQVYVALSRLTSLDGLVLYSPISDSCITSDQSAIDFSKREQSPAVLKSQLEADQISYLRMFLLKAFDWSKLKWEVINFLQDMAGRKIPDQAEAVELITDIKAKVVAQEAVAKKFVHQLNQLLPHALEDHYQQIDARVKAAAEYFRKVLTEEVYMPLCGHYDTMKVKSGVRKYLREVVELTSTARQKHFLLAEMVLLTEGLKQGEKLPKLLQEMGERKKVQQQQVEVEVKKVKKKKVKGESHRMSLEMYKGGKTIDQIAAERSLNPITIEGHLMSFIGTEFMLEEFVPEDKVTAIRAAIDKVGVGEGSKSVKEELGADFSYNEIRAVMNELKNEKE